MPNWPGADNLAENTPNDIPNLFSQIGPNVWDIIEKRLHRSSVVRGKEDQKTFKIELLMKELEEREVKKIKFVIASP